MAVSGQLARRASLDERPLCVIPLGQAALEQSDEPIILPPRRALRQRCCLQMFFREQSGKGRSFADLYELVQHAGNVLPRMYALPGLCCSGCTGVTQGFDRLRCDHRYLLCTVGSCYIRTQEGAAKEVLKDMVEMCKGVQHPTRGLFLRAYLCQASLLPLHVLLC